MEGLTVMVLGGTTITESRLWRKSATSDLGSLSACKVIEKNPIELKHLFLVKSFVSYPRIVSPMVDCHHEDLVPLPTSSTLFMQPTYCTWDDNLYGIHSVDFVSL